MYAAHLFRMAVRFRRQCQNILMIFPNRHGRSHVDQFQESTDNRGRCRDSTNRSEPEPSVFNTVYGRPVPRMLGAQALIGTRDQFYAGRWFGASHSPEPLNGLDPLTRTPTDGSECTLGVTVCIRLCFQTPKNNFVTALMVSLEELNFK